MLEHPVEPSTPAVLLPLHQPDTTLDFYGRPMLGLPPPRDSWRYWDDSNLVILGPPFGTSWLVATRLQVARRDVRPCRAAAAERQSFTGRHLAVPGCRDRP